jgi:hypothetical protein
MYMTFVSCVGVYNLILTQSDGLLWGRVCRVRTNQVMGRNCQNHASGYA